MNEICVDVFLFVVKPVHWGYTSSSFSAKTLKGIIQGEDTDEKGLMSGDRIH